MFYKYNTIFYHKLTLENFFYLCYFIIRVNEQAMTNENVPVKKNPKTNDHLANERTFLAWIRTSISLMGFGFVIVKFAVFIRQMAMMVGDASPQTNPRGSAVVGVVMVAFGALVAIFGYIQFRKVEKRIDAEDYRPSSSLSLLITICILIVSILLMLYLIRTI